MARCTSLFARAEDKIATFFDYQRATERMGIMKTVRVKCKPGQNEDFRFPSTK